MVYIVEYRLGLTFINMELDRCIGDPNSTKKLEGEYLMGKVNRGRSKVIIKWCYRLILMLILIVHNYFIFNIH